MVAGKTANVIIAVVLISPFIVSGADIRSSTRNTCNSWRLFLVVSFVDAFTILMGIIALIVVSLSCPLFISEVCFNSSYGRQTPACEEKYHTHLLEHVR